MADIIKTGSDWLCDQLKTNFATTVSVTRGANTTTGVTATIGQTEFETESEAGVIDYQSRDFLIDADDYQISSAPVLPSRGDLIKETRDSVVYAYEVMAPGDAPPWRYFDSYKKKLRVHTKQISVA